MSKALNSKADDGYKDGTPYEFGSLGLHETMNTAAATPAKSSGKKIQTFNVHGPGTLFYNPPKGSTKGLEELRAARANEKKYGADVCGGCGASEKEGGGKLLTCGTCAIRSTAARTARRSSGSFTRRFAGLRRRKTWHNAVPRDLSDQKLKALPCVA